jgi:nicotinate phosphoribosyltransferase
MEPNPSQNITEHYMNPLFTDFYQITMTYAYWKNGRHKENSVFEAFFRKCPFKGKFTIFAGVEEVTEFLKAFKFTDAHIQYLKAQMPHAEDEFFEWLKQMDTKSLKVNGIPDGTIVFGKQPLLSIEGPIALVQLIETPVLNLINFASLICTNAARMKIKAGEKVKCIEFGLRRAQGPNGALSATKYSFMGGFFGTSNVYAGLLYNIPINGTIAHSFIMSFKDESNIENHHHLDGKDILARSIEVRKELEWEETDDSELYSFISFACSYPDRFLCLIDTFSTLNSGCKNFLIVSVVLSELGHKPSGVRLDSGNLAILSQGCRKLFKEVGDKYGFDYSDLTIVASDDINEDKIQQLNDDKHEIDIFGIGTNLVTCQAQPALGMVYKLVEIEGKPCIKLSEEKEKVLLPGKKKVFRVYDNEIPSFDILLLEEEEDLVSGKEITGYHPFNDGVTKTVENPIKMEKLTQQLFEEGDIKYEQLNLHERRSKVLEQIDQFDPQVVKTNEKIYDVFLSQKCKETFDTLLKSAKFN